MYAPPKGRGSTRGDRGPVPLVPENHNKQRTGRLSFLGRPHLNHIAVLLGWDGVASARAFPATMKCKTMRRARTLSSPEACFVDGPTDPVVNQTGQPEEATLSAHRMEGKRCV